MNIPAFFDCHPEASSKFRERVSPASENPGKIIGVLVTGLGIRSSLQKYPFYGHGIGRPYEQIDLFA